MKQNVNIIWKGKLTARHVQIFIGYFYGARQHDPKGPPPPISRGKDWNRWHLFYTVSGKGFLEWPGRRISLLPRTAVLVAAGTEYTFATDPELKAWNQYSMEFLPRTYWYDWLHWPELAPGIMSLTVPDDACPHVEQSLKTACETAATPHYHWEDFAMAAGEMVLLELDSLNKRPGGKSHKHPPLQRAMEFIEQNQAKALLREEIAAGAGISVSYLNALFQKHLSTTPLHYLDTLRVNQAQRLLRETDESIAQISAACGFSSQTYFGYRFRKLTGFAPSVYRKKLK